MSSFDAKLVGPGHRHRRSATRVDEGYSEHPHSQQDSDSDTADAIIVDAAAAVAAQHHPQGHAAAAAAHWLLAQPADVRTGELFCSYHTCNKQSNVLTLDSNYS